MKATEEENCKLRHPNLPDALDGFKFTVIDFESLKVLEGDVPNMSEKLRLFILICITFMATC